MDVSVHKEALIFLDMIICCFAIGPHENKFIHALLFSSHDDSSRQSCSRSMPLVSLPRLCYSHAHFFLLYSFSGYIILTHTWNSKLAPLSICRGYLYDTSSHPCLRLISSHHAHLCTLVGKLSGAVKRIRLSSMEYFDLWVTGRDAFRHRQLRRTVGVWRGNSREACRVQTQVTHLKKYNYFCMYKVSNE